MPRKNFAKENNIKILSELQYLIIKFKKDTVI